MAVLKKIKSHTHVGGYFTEFPFLKTTLKNEQLNAYKTLICLRKKS